MIVQPFGPTQFSFSEVPQNNTVPQSLLRTIRKAENNQKGRVVTFRRVSSYISVCSDTPLSMKRTGVSSAILVKRLDVGLVTLTAILEKQFKFSPHHASERGYQHTWALTALICISNHCVIMFWMIITEIGILL